MHDAVARQDGHSEYQLTLAKVYAISVDSFITSPSCPVDTSPPPPPLPPSPSSPPPLTGNLVRAVSIYKVEPPMAVHASPITTPGGVVSYMRSEVKTGLPT